MVVVGGGVVDSCEDEVGGLGDILEIHNWLLGAVEDFETIPYPAIAVLNPYCVLSVVNTEGACYCGGDSGWGRMAEAGAKLEWDGRIGRGREELSRYCFAR